MPAARASTTSAFAYGRGSQFLADQPTSSAPTATAINSLDFDFHKDVAAPKRARAAAGRAVVTTDVPWCREAVIDGVTGLLVPAQDPNALAAAIARLVRDPALRRQMSAQGRMLAEQKFSSETVIRQTLALYDEAAT